MSGSVSPYPVIYSFGDSLSDAGDAYLLTTSSAASVLGQSPEPVSPPYYQETYGTTAADLFGNGPVWVQDLAASLGIAVPAPGELSGSAATLDSLLTSQGVSGSQAAEIVGGLEAATGTFSGTIKVAGTAGGTDYAIGGSVTGITGENAGPAVALTDLQAQVSYFETAVAAPVANALYTVWSGSNDLLNLVTDANFASLLASGAAAADVTASVNNEVASVNSLISNGAKSLLVLNVPDLGKTPEALALGAAGDAEASSLASSFNQQLSAALGADNTGGAQVAVEDTYGLIDNAVANPAAYGLTDVTDPVYTGSFTQDDGTLVSSDPAVQDQYLFFDHLHPTETGQMAIAAGAEAALGVVACYCAGTLILTDRGEVAVEALAIGDRVVTAGGAVRPIRWLGQRSYAGRFLAGRQALLPVRLRAGCLGSGLPRRDLRVSPDHAMLLDGLLAPARCLVNGTTIVRDGDVAQVEYFHVELDSHDAILAEGAASETFLDDDSRGVFHNAAEHAALYPDAGTPGGFCAPRVESGFGLEAVRRRLGGIAAASRTSAPPQPDCLRSA